jgi:hypothetical protein
MFDQKKVLDIDPQLLPGQLPAVKIAVRNDRRKRALSATVLYWPASPTAEETARVKRDLSRQKYSRETETLDENLDSCATLIQISSSEARTQNTACSSDNITSNHVLCSIGIVIRTFLKLNVFGVEKRSRLPTGSMPCKHPILEVNVSEIAYINHLGGIRYKIGRQLAAGWTGG